MPSTTVIGPYVLLGVPRAVAQFEYATWVYGDSIGITFGGHTIGMSPTLQHRLFLGMTAFGRTEVWPILLPP